MPVRSLLGFAPASYRSRPTLRSVSEGPPQPVVVILELGYELHQKRKQKSAVTQKEEVEGKKRVTIYVPTAMRTAIGHASVATEKNISTIVSEALELWMAKHGLRY